MKKTKIKHCRKRIHEVMLTTRIPTNLFSEMKLICKNTKMNRSEFVRLALIKFKKSPLFPIILFILLFFGIQIYFKFII